MKLYRHYKQKFYKYLGTVRHSETQEELALYDCLYPNPSGQTWVRPQSMFDEIIEHEGRKIPRFERVVIKVQETKNLSTADLDIVSHLMQAAFGEWDPHEFYSTFDHHKGYHLLVASLDDQPIGFKLGYARSKEVFYSWLGGVSPEFRSLGVATELLLRQHAWCKQQGFKLIETNTRNAFKPMLILNLKHGFDIVGSNLNEKGFLLLRLRKNLE